jgi:hypothetical protein
VLICLCYRVGENEPLIDGTDDVMTSLHAQASSIDQNDQLFLAEIHAIPAEAGWLAGLVDELVEAA